jgi:hypothetical protein
MINTAVPGYNSRMEVATLRHKGLALQPDFVLIEFVGNDLALPNFIREQKPIYDFRRSFLTELIDRRWRRSRPPELSRFEKEMAKHGFHPAPRDDSRQHFLSDPEEVPSEYRNMVGWLAYETAMADLKTMAVEQGFEVIWITLMQKHPMRQRAMGIARRHGFHIVDVGSYFRRYLKQRGLPRYMHSALALSPTDGHPSALGHELAAKRLYAYFMAEDLLRPTSADAPLAATPDSTLSGGLRHAPVHRNHDPHRMTRF